MLGFIKKLFGAKTEETVPAPYKVEVPAAASAATAPVVKPQITDAVTTAPVAETKSKKVTPRKKPTQAKSTGQKPVAPKQGGNRGRKPKQAK